MAVIKMDKMLKPFADNLIKAHPSLAPQLQRGLILAIAGRVKETEQDNDGRPSTWEVHSEARFFTVTVSGLPRRWHCNCEQGRDFGPLTPNFVGHPGRICKHIAAVGLLWLSDSELIVPASSIWELFTRLVNEQAIYLAPNQDELLPTKHNVKLERYDKNGRDGLVLKTGKARSEVLARWLPVEGQPAGAAWQLVADAETRYEAFKERVLSAIEGKVTNANP